MIKLTDKQETFCLAYIENGRNATAAAREAGYAHPQNDGWVALQKDYVREYIEKLYVERNRRLGVSKDYVLAELLDQLQVLKAEVKPKLNAKTGKAIKDEDGNPIYVRNEAAITKVLELIGKVAGIDAFNNKINVEVTREEDLINAIYEGRKQAGLVE